MMKQSADGRKFLEAREALRLVAYKDGGGVWTLGYGHTHGIKKGDTCTEEQADEWLSQDVAPVERAINEHILVQLNQNQFDALCSFSLNVGISAFLVSTLLRRLNQGNFTLAAHEFDQWIFDNGQVVQGLINRRALERKLFEKV